MLLTHNTQVEVLIVGAGICGLLAARTLNAVGYRTLNVDKGRSVGGRLATRRVGSGLADHGAQFFTVREPEFQALVDRWLADGVIFEWSRGWSDGSTAHETDGHLRYAAHGGMNALAKHIAQEVETRVDTKITAIGLSPDGSEWQARDENNGTFHARAVLLTPPVPQSLALIDAGDVTLESGQRAALTAIEYEPCLAAMITVEGEVRLPPPGVLQRIGAPLQWIGDNQRKGLSPDATILTVQASGAYSRQLWDRTDDEVLDSFRVDLMPILGEVAHITAAELKRWRYSAPTSSYPERVLMADGLLPLAFAGDAFAGPRVEGAAMSGLAAARALTAALQG